MNRYSEISEYFITAAVVSSANHLRATAAVLPQKVGIFYHRWRYIIFFFKTYNQEYLT